MSIKEELCKINKLIEQSKQMVTDFKIKYPDDPDIIKLEERINDYKKLIPIDWDEVQLKYEEYCNIFSPAYLSGCRWYQIIGKDFKKGYQRSKILKNYSDNYGLYQ